ncbi:hypothetical protein GCM10022254_31480 [Actinomadura meridiana]|uniref:RNA polymerase sigma factor 70 region 4 type 2 domain-containing protein n=1 Tax=Actinomadura meridiana TaxID=559626 RepID=A0ABP8C202_9ACTN
MPGDLETLYDAHAHRLYAHCWSLLGDHGAPDAFKDVFTEAMRRPPRGETVLFLHQLVRTVCTQRGAFDARHRLAQNVTDPLLNAASDLPAEYREALLLYAGEWLDVNDLARVLAVSPDDVRRLLHKARTTLESSVLDALMRGTADAADHMDVIAAFEQGRLPHLLARRAPAWAPAPLRDHVVAVADDPLDRLDGVLTEPETATGPLVVIGPDTGPGADPARDRSRRRRALIKGVGGVAGVAASVTVGLLMTWPSPGEGTANALGPHGGNNLPGPAPAGGMTSKAGVPDRPVDVPRAGVPAPDPAPTSGATTPVNERPGSPGGGTTGRTTPPPPSDPSTPPPTTPPTDTREDPGTPSPNPTEQPPTEQPPEDGSRTEGPLDPVTDVIGHVTSPILGGLAG